MTVAGFAGALLLWGVPIAVTSPTVPPEGTFWTVEERPVRLRLLSPAERRTGQTIFLEASVELDESCLHPGPVFPVIDRPAGSPRQFRAHVWRQHGAPCDRVSRSVTQPIEAPTRRPGTVRFAAGSTVIEVKVSGKPHDRDRDDDASSRPCRFDDDCWVTDVCVPRKSNPTGLGICAEICGGAFDCAPGRCDRGPAIVGICSDRVVGCDARHPCEWGQVCTRGGYCYWPTRLDSGSRHDCQSDADCGPGLKCFKRGGANAAHGRCELLCNSSHMACEGAHECRGVGICEWLGG